MVLLVLALVLNVLLLGTGAVYKDAELNEIFPEKIRQDPTYFVIASKIVRPGQVYRLSVTILDSSSPIIVRASVLRDGVELASVSENCRPNIIHMLDLKIPLSSHPGSYKLRVEGDIYGILGSKAFLNETVLTFSQRSMTIFIQTDKPLYRQGDLVRFRAIPVTTDLKAFSDAIDVFMIDSRGTIMRRWMSRQTNLGAVSLEYQLSKQPLFGNWTIRVVAQGQIEEKTFFVEEYYETPYEVNVTLPPFIMDNEEFITGFITANYTSGAPVSGNLTIRAFAETLEPQYKAYKKLPEKRYYVEYFEGHTVFRFSMNDLRELLPRLENSRITVAVDVGERYLNRIETGFAQSVIVKSGLKLRFFGSSPQVFKPAMPFKTYILISYRDGSSLPSWRLTEQKVRVDIVVNFKSGNKRKMDTRFEQMSPIHFGIWEITVDLMSEFESLSMVNDVYSILLEARYEDDTGDVAEASLLAYASYTPSSSHIHVSTSTRGAKVGEYVIFHVRADYYIGKFSYLIVSKGNILVSGVEEMTSSIKTFAVTVSADMTPSATIIVYHIEREGEVVADGLTFSVDGISRNNVSLTLNTNKDKSGETVEIVVEGKPGTFVGISAVHSTLYEMQAGNGLSYSEVLEKMNLYGQITDEMDSYSWLRSEANFKQFLRFPLSSYAIDASKIFEHSGLTVFTDAIVPKLKDSCGRISGYVSCMDGSCYRKEKRCDGHFECADGSDESRFFCRMYRKGFRKETFNKADYLRTRTNHIQSLFENTWLWHDINIGPLGHHIFKVKVPNAPMNWVVNAFSMNSDHGFGMLSDPLQFENQKSFYMVVEMPSKCVIGEQISIKISVFNHHIIDMEVLVMLARSTDYRFVHVESFGVSDSYDPRTSQEEQHHLVFIKSGKSVVVYMPIVATRTGSINVTVMSKTFVAKHLVTKTLMVEPYGVPQYRHTSIVLDLTQGAYLIKYLDTNLTESPVVPYRQERLYTFDSNKAKISVTGDLFGATFPTMPVNVSSLLRKPSWCAEQNMFSFAANLYTLLFMRLSGERKPDVEKQAFHYLNIGYQRQLSYQKDDGSFSPFRWNTESSVWLTAFCARIFHRATFQEWENFLYIDPSVISKAVAWVIQHQSPVGAFYETTEHLYDRKMNLTSDRLNDHVRYRNISLTAHVLITLAEVKDLKGDLGVRAVRAKQAARRYLENMLHIVKDYTDPYDIAIVAFALTISKSTEAEKAFSIMDGTMREARGFHYWSKTLVPAAHMKIENNRPYVLPRLPHMYEALNIETTAYALLVHVHRQAVIQKEIAQWLNVQRSTDGGWASTQDTLIAMQALMAYSAGSRMRDITDVSITVEAPSSPGFSKVFQIDDRNLLELQTVEVPNAWGPVIVKAQGSGIAVVQLSVEYGVDWKHLITPPPAPAFSLDVKAHFFGRNSSHLVISSCQSWYMSSESIYSGMAVLELGVPTGYIIPQNELHNLVRSGKVRNLKEARFSERKVIFYFSFLESSPICVSFTVQRWYPVANMTRYLPAKVYDYYAPERYNETMLDMYALNVLGVCQVCGSYQCPYCPVFSICSRLKLSTPLLSMLAVALFFLHCLTALV